MTAAKKTTKKKKSTIAKKTVRKGDKNLVGSKKTAKRTKVKKVAQKSTRSKTKKKTTKAPAKQTINRRKKETSHKTNKVTLPSSAGPRLKSKVVAAEHFIEQLRKPMYRIAYVTGLSFVLVGLVAITSLQIKPVAQSATSVCSDDGVCTDDGDDLTLSNSVNDDLTTATDGGSTGVEESLEPAVFEVYDQLPRELTSDVILAIKVLNHKSIHFEVTRLESGHIVKLNPERLSESNYQLVLEPKDFDFGQHHLVAILRDFQGTREIFVSEFYVPPETSDPSLDSTIETDIDTESDTTITDSEMEITDAAVDNSADTSIDNEPQTDTESSTQKSKDITTESEINASNTSSFFEESEPEKDGSELSEEPPKETIDVDDSPSEPEEKFKFIRLNSNWEDREAVVVSAPSSFTNIELYLRPIQSIQAQFLGTMRVVDKDLIYTFDSTNWPNGEYEIFATARHEDRLILSESESVTIRNQSLQLSTTDTNTIKINTDDSEAETPVREFYQLKEEDIQPDEETIDTIIRNNAEELNELLEKYAIAQQTDDSILKDAVNQNIENKRKTIIREVLQTEEKQDNVSQIEIALNTRINTIKERVDTFEKIRQSRLGDTVRNDSDGDGISDFDETNVYQTDPTSADSDGDGFTDGAEILRGFNPRNTESETIIDYELPTEVVGLQRSDVLAVSEVTSVAVEENEAEPTAVFAEISGTGLPNSYVTVYIFSTPIIVSVKTDEDGSFVYRFDKELADGEHEVFVAFTDNTGAILAHSEPFRFVKQARAFTPVDAEVETVSITGSSVVDESTINVVQYVLGVTVIVLGFFLVMLGINLRETAPKPEKVDVVS